MTVSTETNRQTHAGNGATIVFAVPFRFLDNAHVAVTHRDAAGAETAWAEGTQYTLVGAGEAAGGTLTVITAPTDYTPAADESLTVVRDVPLTQETDYVENDPFPADSHERALDKLTMIDQELSEALGRTFSIPVADGFAGSFVLPIDSARANKALHFDSGGGPIAVVPTDASGQIVTATGSTTGRALAERAAEIIDIRDHGAIGTGDDTAAIQAAIDRALVVLAANAGAYVLVFKPPGTYSVTSLTYDTRIGFFGPGRIVPSAEFQTDEYGGIWRSGVKTAFTNPIDKHGGVMVGGEGPTPHGMLMKSQYLASMDLLPSRQFNPTEVQLYPHHVTGVCSSTGTDRATYVKGFDADLSDFHVNDHFWFADTEYKIGALASATAIDLELLTGGAATLPVGSFSCFCLYFNADTVVDITGTAVTRVSGEAFPDWGSDNNLIVDGARLEVSSVTDADNLVLAAAPGDETGKAAIMRWLSSENFVELLRWQRLQGQDTEETLSIAARPDEYRVRVGRTGDGIGRYSPMHFMGPPLADDPFPNNDEPQTWLTLSEDGFVGIHKREPEGLLHIARRNTATQGNDDTNSIIVRIDGEWDTAAGRRAMDITARNDFNAPFIQGRSDPTLSATADIEIQPEGGKVTFGGPVAVKEYTVATLPTVLVAGLIYVSDEAGGAVLAFSNGVNWLRCTDRAIVS